MEPSPQPASSETEVSFALNLAGQNERDTARQWIQKAPRPTNFEGQVDVRLLESKKVAATLFRPTATVIVENPDQYTNHCDTGHDINLVRFGLTDNSSPLIAPSG